MDNSKDNTSIPVGTEFLKLVRDLENRCEVAFDNWIPSAGTKVPQTFEALGTSLSYLGPSCVVLVGMQRGEPS